MTTFRPGEHQVRNLLSRHQKPLKESHGISILYDEVSTFLPDDFGVKNSMFDVDPVYVYRIISSVESYLICINVTPENCPASGVRPTPLSWKVIRFFQLRGANISIFTVYPKKLAFMLPSLPVVGHWTKAKLEVRNNEIHIMGVVK